MSEKESLLNGIERDTDSVSDIRGEQALKIAQLIRYSQLNNDSRALRELIALLSDDPDIRLLDVVSKLVNVTKREADKARKALASKPQRRSIRTT